MPGAAVTTYTRTKLVPLYSSRLARCKPVQLGPSLTLAAGTVLGQITTAVNDVQTFTATGTPTGGSFSYTVTNPLTGVQSTLTIPYNATSTSLLALAVAILGTGNVTAGGGAWPGTALTLTGAGALAGRAIPVAVAGTNAFTGGTSPASTVAHTTTGIHAGQHKAYASGNSDGSEVPRVILEYACTTDTAGNITSSDMPGQSALSTSAFYCGTFDTADLTGLDANAVTLLGGNLVAGTTTAGTFHF